MNDPYPAITLAVIADDLTGANDTGVQFAKQGLKTLVMMGARPDTGSIAANVAVVDSRSRALPPAAAYRNTAEAAGCFRQSRFRTFFKKIDSTLRGNIGAEIDAVMDTCGLEAAVVAPAFPKNGRTTVAGRVLLHGVPLAETEVARDPLSPLSQSHVPTLLSGQTRRRVGHLEIGNLTGHPREVLNRMREMIASGDRIIVCDAWHDGHLQAIAAAAAGLEQEILWVGSAGLAEFVPAALGWVWTGSLPTRIRQKQPGGPVVVMAGSVSAVTRAQVAMFRERPGTGYIEMDAGSLLLSGTAQSETARCLELARRMLREGLDLAVTPGSSPEAVARTRSMADGLDLSAQQTADRIAAAMGSLCARIAGAFPLAGLVMTGGDIALGCCVSLAATGIEVLSEVAPGIPLGELRGGPSDGLEVVTKAGAFGAEDALCRAAERLKG